LLPTTELKSALPSPPPASQDSPSLAPCAELSEEAALPAVEQEQETGQEERQEKGQEEREDEGQERGQKEQQDITHPTPRRTKRIRKAVQLPPGMIYYY
jgi:hypothetical protein